jgi:hypothetical protein
MKKVKKQFILMIVFLVNSAFLHGLMRLGGSKAPGRSITSGISPAAAAAAHSAAMKSRASSVSTQLDTSTWSGWFQSFFQKPQLKSQPFQPTRSPGTRMAPLGSRSFSTTPVQRSSFWEKIGSFFEQKSPEERFAYDFDEILRGTAIKENERKFTREDLETAKKFIDGNEEFINVLLPNYYSLGESERIWGHPGKLGITRRNGNTGVGKVLDDVLACCFLYILNDSNYYSTYYDTNLETIKNYLELAKYIANKGGQLLSMRVLGGSYADLYDQRLMSDYKSLHAVDYSSPYRPWPAPELKKLEALREIFRELDPLLEQLWPKFKDGLRRAQKTRADIDSDPKAYRQALQDEEDRKDPRRKQLRDQANREEYLRSKRKRKEVLWRKAHGNWDPDVRLQEWNDVEFNEAEYKEWLKDWRFFFNFDYGPSWPYGRGSNAQYEDTYEHKYEDKFEHASENESEDEYEDESGKKDLRSAKKSICNLLPGLTIASSKEDIAKAYRVFQLKNHPDILAKDIPDVERKKIVRKVKKVNAAWDDYHEQLKKEKLKKQKQTVKE